MKKKVEEDLKEHEKVQTILNVVCPLGTNQIFMKSLGNVALV